MKAVLLMAYGTPRNLQEVEAYYTHIRGGRKPSEAELANLVDRYRAIGGTSPLIEITEGQRAKLELRIRAAGSNTKVYAGMKHSEPFIGDVVREANDEGVDELLGLVLAPHYSRISVGSYIATVKDANEKLGSRIKLDFVESWHDNPALIDLWSGLVRDAGSRFGGRYWLVFSAHSLPVRILSEGDPYRDELLRTSELVAAKTNTRDWSFSFQSASHTHEPWLGPDILEHLKSIFDKGERSFLIAPIGFVSDHLEILYDIDIECREWARSVGVKVERCDTPNGSEKFADCLFSIVAGRGFLANFLF